MRNGFSSGGTARWWQWVRETTTHSAIFLAAIAGTGIALHLGLRELAARSLSGWLKKEQDSLPIKINLLQAFRKNTRPWRSLLHKKHAGWNRRTRRMLTTIINQADDYVQQLNDRFTNPSGDQGSTGNSPGTNTDTVGNERKIS